MVVRSFIAYPLLWFAFQLDATRVAGEQEKADLEAVRNFIETTKKTAGDEDTPVKNLTNDYKVRQPIERFKEGGVSVAQWIPKYL